MKDWAHKYSQEVLFPDSKVQIVGSAVSCPSCGAVCSDKKDLARFKRRHPKLCQERKEFNKQLAAGVRSVEDRIDD